MKKNYLEMIQKVIARMGNNSFLLKGWAVLVIVAIFTFTKESNNVKIILFTNIPLVVFWGLDSYYLQLERKYRLLFDHVRNNISEKDVDYNLNPNLISVTLKDSKKVSFFNCLFSITELLYYGTCIVTTILIYIFA